jgi:hypothetical protein
MEQLAMLGETIGTLFLLGAVAGIFYVFYRILKFAFSAIKDNND